MKSSDLAGRKMKSRKLLYVAAVTLFAAVPAALASTTWYVNGVSGSDSNNCISTTTACKTIGHAISLASSGDSVRVAPATYTENLTISFNLKIIGAGAVTTIVDGGGTNTVVAIPNAGTVVTISGFTIRNGRTFRFFTRSGGGINNYGTLTLIDSTLSGNSAGSGGGIFNGGSLTVNKCSINRNTAVAARAKGTSYGGGISNQGTLTVNNSTISGNTAASIFIEQIYGAGGGISNFGTLTVNNSTISGNTTGSTQFGNAGFAGGIYNDNAGKLTVNNSTVSENIAGSVGGIYGFGTETLQNSIVAYNSPGNCDATITSQGYNLSDDGSCDFDGPGDLNNTDPMLGPLQNNGGPTQTQALLSGSPAIDSGNPGGCTDGQGHLLKTDQRGQPRPNPEDTGGCDRGAYERQTD
jgi:hypothetical protein